MKDVVMTTEDVRLLSNIKQTRKNWDKQKQVKTGRIYPNLDDIGISKKEFSKLKRKGFVESRGFGPDLTNSATFGLLFGNFGLELTKLFNELIGE